MKIKALSLLIAICMVVGMVPAVSAAGIEDYPALTYGVEMTLECNSVEKTYVTFTPETSGTYRFYSVGDEDTVARLYDAQMSQIAYNDDCRDKEAHGHEGSSNFCIVAELEAGAAYVLGVQFFSSGVTEMTVAVGHGHDYVTEILQEPTCSEKGSARHTCVTCGYAYTQTLYTIAHTYTTEVTKEPTCTEDGVLTYTCAVCAYNYTEVIHSLDHAYDENLRCTRCGIDHPTSGTWTDDDGRSLNWLFLDGMLILSGEGKMPAVIQDHDYWWNPIYIPDTPWLALPVTEVVVSNGITDVSAGAFKGSEKLEKVTLPASVTRIGMQAFQNCSKLTSINFPDDLTDIQSYAFSGCDLREVVLPPFFAYEDFYAGLASVFEGNLNLERFVVAEDSVVYASDAQGALYNKDMTELLLVPLAASTYTLPASVLEISWNRVLYDCAKLESIYVEAGNADWYSKDGILYGPLMEYVYDEELDDSVKQKVGVELFCCPPAKNVGAFTIGSDVDSLAENAFTNCRYLTELTIPASCMVGENGTIGSCVPYCTALEAVWFEEGHPYYFSDEEGVVFNQNTDLYIHPSTDEPVYLERGETLAYLPAGRTGYYAVPEGVRYLEHMSIVDSRLSAIRFPASLEAFSYYAVDHGTIEWMLFTGEKPRNTSMTDDIDTFTHMNAKVYHPDWLSSWEEPSLNDGFEDLTYIPYEQGKEPVWGEEEPVEPENPFTDVPADSFYAEPVAWAVENGITTGASENSFNPDGQCLRAQVVTFLWRAEGCPEPESLNNPFVDVKESDFYFKAVLWAVENKITNGSDATHFNPFGVCNRAQVVTFLHRAKGSPAPQSMDLPFTDVPAGTWYAEPIAWAVEKNITNGLSATQFGPDAACNRAQVVTFLYRAFAK